MISRHVIWHGFGFFGRVLEELHLLVLSDTIELPEWPYILRVSLSLSTHLCGSIPLYQSFPLLCLSGPGPAGFIRTSSSFSSFSSIPHWLLMSVAHFSPLSTGLFYLQRSPSLDHYTHFLGIFLQAHNWRLMKQSLCPLYFFFFFLINLCVFSTSAFGSRLFALTGSDSKC